MLTEKEAVFCREYLIDLNATQAAIRAGYSARSAQDNAYRLIKRPHVRCEIDRLMAERSRRTGVTADRVLQELARIAFANPNDVLDLENGTVREGLSDDDAALIAGVKFKVVPNREGQSVEREIKLYDKVKALELLGRHLSLFEDKLKVDGVVPVVITGGDELNA